MPLCRAIGFAPATTIRKPSRKIACARTVAVVVPSPATSDVFEATSLTIGAPTFCSLSSSSISFATVTPSFVIVGEPNFFSSTTLRPRGPSVTFTASASLYTPARIAWRDRSPCTTFFAAIFFDLLNSQLVTTGYDRTFLERLLLSTLRFSRSDEDAKNFVFAHDQIVLTIDHNIRAAVLAEEHTISGLNVHWLPCAVLIDLAQTNGNHLALLRFLFRSVGNNDSAGCYFRLLDAFD